MGQGRFSVKTDPSAEGQLLRAWDQQLVGAGARITVRRAQVVLDLSGRARDAHRRIAGDEAELALVYRPSVECPEGGVEEVAEAFRLRLAQLRQAELTRGVTLAGPHRDDFRFELDGVDLGAFGSQGQQRSAVLALKLAEVDFITERVSERPVLLLDDVLSGWTPAGGSASWSLWRAGARPSDQRGAGLRGADARRRQSVRHSTRGGF